MRAAAERDHFSGVAFLWPACKECITVPPIIVIDIVLMTFSISVIEAHFH